MILRELDVTLQKNSNTYGRCSLFILSYTSIPRVSTTIALHTSILFFKILLLLLLLLNLCLFTSRGNIGSKETQAQSTAGTPSVNSKQFHKINVTNLLAFLSIIRVTETFDFQMGSTSSWVRLRRHVIKARQRAKYLNIPYTIQIPKREPHNMAPRR